MTNITIERVRQVLDYEAATGVFRWKIKPNRRIKVGSVAGSMRGGYVVLSVDGVDVLAHRAAWAVTFGVWPALVDHKDRNRCNNALANLRDADRSLNAQNMDVRNGRGVTGLRGVAVNTSRGCFTASIHVDGKSQYLGRFSTPEEAHAAYLRAKPVYHPEAFA